MSILEHSPLYFLILRYTRNIYIYIYIYICVCVCVYVCVCVCVCVCVYSIHIFYCDTSIPYMYSKVNSLTTEGHPILNVTTTTTKESRVHICTPQSVPHWSVDTVTLVFRFTGMYQYISIINS